MEMRREIPGMDTETILDALNDFERKPSPNVPPVLENLLVWIAKTGDTLYPWKKLKPLFICKLEKVIQEYVSINREEVPLAPNVENVAFDDMRNRLVKAINTFAYAPFTIQRLCELITDPKRYYKRSDKFMRGIEKNIMVVSTVSPNGKRLSRNSDFETPVPMMNGIDNDCNHDNSNNVAERMDTDNNTQSNIENVSNTHSNNLPASDTVVLNDAVSQAEPALDSNTEEKTSIGGPEGMEVATSVAVPQTTEDEPSTDVEKEKPEELTTTPEQTVPESKESIQLADTKSDNDPANQPEESKQLEDSTQSSASSQSKQSNQSEASRQLEDSIQSSACSQSKQSNQSEVAKQLDDSTQSAVSSQSQQSTQSEGLKQLEDSTQSDASSQSKQSTQSEASKQSEDSTQSAASSQSKLSTQSEASKQDSTQSLTSLGTSSESQTASQTKELSDNEMDQS